jgi:hypothetical protein
MSKQRICRCCGERFGTIIDSENPNVCPGCVQLLEDETPVWLAEMFERMALPTRVPTLFVAVESQPVPADAGR